MLQRITDALRTILFIADLFLMVDAHFRAHQQKSVVFKFLPIERKSIQGPRRRSAPGRHSIRACLTAINPSKLATARAHFCSPVCNGTSGYTPRSSGPCHAAFDLQVWMIDGCRLCIWL
jgi:hypothetical protein